MARTTAWRANDSTGRKIDRSMAFQAQTNKIIVSNGGKSTANPRNVAIRNGLNERRNQFVDFEDSELDSVVTKGGALDSDCKSLSVL